MASASEIERYRAANAGLVTLVERDLTAFWRTLDLSKPEAARDALLRHVPSVVTQYGESAASIAADWYDDLRLAEGARGRFVAEMADPVADALIDAQVRFGAQHLFTDTPDQMLPFLVQAAAKYVLAPGRATIVNNSLRDPAASGWHRETRPSTSFPSGCRFCRMLAQRGAVYKRETVDFAAHGGCHCVGVPSWDPNAPEVDARAYVASERMGKVRARAAAGNDKAQRRLDEHNARVRAFLDAMPD